MLYTNASKYGWAGVLMQKHTSSVGGKEITMDHLVSYVSGLFHGSQLNWAALTKKDYAIYMSIKISTFYLTGNEITLRSDHLPLKKFLWKMTLNNTVNDWSTEIESFNIHFVHISGKANILADTLSRLIDTNPDLKQQHRDRFRRRECWLVYTSSCHIRVLMEQLESIALQAHTCKYCKETYLSCSLFFHV